MLTEKRPLIDLNPFENPVKFLQAEFLAGSLSFRDLEKRYSVGEKVELTAFVQKAWELRKPMLSSATDIGWRTTGVLGLGDLTETGNYDDGEPFGKVTSEGPDISYTANSYFWANMPASDLLTVARARADELIRGGMERLALVCPYMPFQRAERPRKRSDGTRELTVARRAIKDLSEQFDTIITLDAHSSGTAFFCMENGIPILDLSAIPLLIAKAKYEECIDDKMKIVVVAGDDGAFELGKMTQYLLSFLFRDKVVPFIQGYKSKEEVDTNGEKKIKTTVDFDEEELEQVSQTTVIIPEDIICSGGTMRDTVKKLKDAGAKRIVIVATHAIFTPGVEELIKEDSVHIIVSNSRMDQDTLPQHIQDLTEGERKKLYFVNILEPLKNVVGLDRRGKLNHVFRYNWESLLAETGLCLSPWQMPYFRQR